MLDILVHPRTDVQITQYLTAPSHALLLVGANGIGKTWLARMLAAQLLDLRAQDITQYPYYWDIENVDTVIPIDAIRELQRFLQLKTPGHEERTFRRIVIVEHAERLTIEAQNAFLKILEEPPADTCIILTASNQRALLPTILSRLQKITVYPPAEKKVREYFAAQAKDTARVTQAYFLSGGLPGLMHALLLDDTAHPLMQAVTQAKTVLQAKPFERLAMVESLSKQKEGSHYMLEALLLIAQTGLGRAAQAKDTARVTQWHRILRAVNQALARQSHHANTKLLLTTLMLQL